jgi:rhodanese-related sulfurtransferase
MKTTLNPRILLSGIIILLGLIIAAVPENTTRPFMLTAEEILDEVKNGEQFIYPDQVADMIIQKDPSLLLIDVRTPEEYQKYGLPGSFNIPLDNVLADEWYDYVNQDIYLNVFYSNGNTRANEAWMITRQLGYENNYVLIGGLNYWVETILNPTPPSSTDPDDEFAKYDFRKAASFALGGGGDLSPDSTGQNTKTKKPTIIKRKKKKKVEGGC